MGRLALPTLVFAVVGGIAPSARAEVRIVLEDGAIVARPAEPTASLEVSVDVPGDPPPLLGRTRRSGTSLRFEPRFPFQPGMRFRVLYRESPASPSLVRIIETAPAPVREATRVVAIHPSADLLPENQLKLYLQFSAAMRRGEAYLRVRLLDDAGHPVELPFLEIGQELWDPGATRLTLLFDPGRVKRDLVPNEEVGPPLHEGRSYTLLVDRGWRDARGQTLAEDVRKAFRVAAPDYDSPQTRDWKIIAPVAGGRGPLTIQFPEPLDRAMLESAIAVATPAGAPVDGRVEIDAEETRWRFTPTRPWERGGYSVLVATILEDLAGNSLDRPFEVDRFERIAERIHPSTETLTFTVE